MKTRLLVMVGMMISTTIFAQRASTRDTRKPEANGYERMKRELALSEDQYASVKRIDSKYDKKGEAQRTKVERRRVEEKEEMRAFRTKREREMRNVFTPAQNLKWDKLKSERKEKSRKHRGAHRKHGKHFHTHDKKDMRKNDRSDDRGEHRHGGR